MAEWAEILKTCNGVGSYGCADQFMDISWQAQVPATTSFVNVNNLVGFDDHNMMGGGYDAIFQQQQKHKAKISGPSLANPDQPLKTCRRTQIQRANHILAERQRREEMNDKFSILRSSIPRPIKKDKASILAETIDYVIEMERTLRHLKGCRAKRRAGHQHVPSKLRKSEASHTTIVNREEAVERRGQWKCGEVEVEEVGGSGHAVIKIRGRRRRGVVEQIHVAFEECKLDVLQSNITTVGDMMILFTTVQMFPGERADMNSLLHAITEAFSNT